MAFTFIPQVFQQVAIAKPAYSSQPTLPSPKTHYYSPKKSPIANANNQHIKQSQSYSPMNNNNINISPQSIHQQSKSTSNITFK